ncbi:MAG: tRNA pseudouridine(55) synthase TruB [Gemmatimonadota bacterium]|nr:MAG: tRNA pseudouridine(55) synthase TruB [Gemmatimonadota bacterium]
MDGILIIDKPRGLTSHDVVLKIRHLIGESKVGHTGTLDPMATGVLPVCMGKATKIAQYITRKKKEYIATLKLGVTTDTLDAEGTVLEKRSTHATLQDIKDVLSSFQGEIEQTPPMFSAIKHAGKRLYQRARNGETVSRPSRRIHIFNLDLIEVHNDDLKILVQCSPGTYIRSLAADIGETLGCGAHITALQRTRVGQFGLEDACTLEEIERFMKTGVLQKHIVSINDALSSLPKIRVGAAEGYRIANGAPVVRQIGFETQTWTDEQRTIRIVGSDDTLLGLGTLEGPTSQEEFYLKPIRVLV